MKRRMKMRIRVTKVPMANLSLSRKARSAKPKTVLRAMVKVQRRREAGLRELLRRKQSPRPRRRRQPSPLLQPTAKRRAEDGLKELGLVPLLRRRRKRRRSHRRQRHPQPELESVRGVPRTRSYCLRYAYFKVRGKEFIKNEGINWHFQSRKGY